jgi:hypothetical protein
VLTFVQAAVTLVATFYVFVLASVAGVAAREPDSGVLGGLGGLATEGRIVSAVQLAGVVLLVVGGVLALSRRSLLAWRLLVAALVAQLALVVYWIVRIGTLTADLGSGDNPRTVFLVLGIAFAVLPATALVLACLAPSRQWLRPAGMPGAGGG